MIDELTLSNEVSERVTFFNDGRDSLGVEINSLNTLNRAYEGVCTVLYNELGQCAKYYIDENITPTFIKFISQIGKEF